MENNTSIQQNNTSIQHSNEINELALALSQAQGEMETAKKNTTNPYFKTTYSDLASVWETCRAPLSKHGLAIIQTCMPSTGNYHFIQIITTLIHKSGQWFKSTLDMPILKKDPQSIGALLTYGRRYSLMAIVGIAPEDDDAESAIIRSVATSSSTHTNIYKPEKIIDPPNKNTQPGDETEEYKKTTAQLLEINSWLLDMSGNNQEAAQDTFKMLTKYKDFEGFNSLKALRKVKEKNNSRFYAIYNTIKDHHKKYHDTVVKNNNNEPEEVINE